MAKTARLAGEAGRLAVVGAYLYLAWTGSWDTLAVAPALALFALEAVLESRASRLWGRHRRQGRTRDGQPG